MTRAKIYQYLYLSKYFLQNVEKNIFCGKLLRAALQNPHCYLGVTGCIACVMSQTTISATTHIRLFPVEREEKAGGKAERWGKTVRKRTVGVSKADSCQE
jgi:hypothetical protein